jgi:UDP-N-acetylglucosamine--N-acetylmuramyl-(pentapeptide) pyrophosphoryl-undecaprenol N-acetylglucosamine transferase
MHAVALPVEVYPYPTEKTVTVGVPVSTLYQRVTTELQRQYRQELGLAFKHIIFLTGGGNGSRELNEALVANVRYLLSTFSDLAIIHVSGRNLEAETNAKYDALQLGEARKRVIVHGFVMDLYRQSGAADVVISRGGATNLAEFAIQGKACIIVPAPQLVGGHQVKNVSVLAKDKAVLQMTEDQLEQPERLGRTISELISDDKQRNMLAQRFLAYAHPQAAAELAALILKIAGGEGHVRAER